jgi:uncharacterized protein
MVEEAEGTLAVALARRAVAEAAGARSRAQVLRALPPLFDEPRGVFVTLKSGPGDRLRGCIGYPRPILPLGTAIVQAAVAAAVQDPRFPPVHAGEVDDLRVEVSVLTPPEAIAAGDPGALVGAIEVGRDGLIVDAPRASGLLLPQVAAEAGWTAEEFLRATCEKAGLVPDAWRTEAVRVLRFEAEVFAETAPGGPVVRVRSGEPRSTDARGPRSGAPRTPTSLPQAPSAAPPPRG